MTTACLHVDAHPMILDAADIVVMSAMSYTYLGCSSFSHLDRRQDIEHDPLEVQSTHVQLPERPSMEAILCP